MTLRKIGFQRPGVVQIVRTEYPAAHVAQLRLQRIQTRQLERGFAQVNKP